VNDLERFFYANKGGQIHKMKHYFEVYDRHFARYRGTDVHVVEVGVAHGGSLRMWRDYFGRKSTIFGIDIQPAAKSLEGEGMRVIVGDQGNPAFLASLIEQVPRMDILIDDGGHSMYQQETTFRVLFPHIQPDGVYLCEDLHTSYWDEFGGGYRRPGTFIELSKTLIDEINAWHSRSPELGPSDFTRSAGSLHFYDSILVVEKQPRERPEDVVTGVPTIEWTSPPSLGPLNSVVPRPSLPRRVVRKIPGHSTVARAVRRLARPRSKG
jgi:hypothetical protein